MLEILTFVHQENIIHRDIKPANIMRRDQDSKLVLIDFGAVKEKLTVDKRGQTSVVIGTPPYIAPEQGMGKPEKCSDIYSVGILGIQALTGLASRDLPQDSDQFRQILEDLQIQINPQLESVLSKMISFQPQNRFPYAAEVLEAMISTNIVEHAQESVHTDIIEPPTKKLFLALLGIIAFISALFYISRFFSQPNYAQLEKYLQNEQWQQADEESDRIIVKIAGETSALDAESIANFPCKPLGKIDQLWINNSDGRFGFAPQKQAYLETGNQIGQYTESTYEAFGDRVGWRTFNSWSLYGDLKFTDIAPVGHLPSPGIVGAYKDLRWRERGMLLSRFSECGL